MWPKGLVGPLKVSHHPAKFGGHSHFGSGDIMALNWKVILQDHVVKGSKGLCGEDQSR